MAFDGRDKAWLVPDAMNQIKSTLNREQDFETNLLAVSLDQGLGEITLADRDEAVYRLRFLKFWFGYPSIVFLTAVSVLDRFLIKMKVQRKYLQCLVISCLYIAVKLGHYNIDTKNLVTLSQSKCSVKDMERMSEIVRQKLNLQSEKQFSVFDYLSQFLNLLKTVAVHFEIKSLFNVILKRKTLLSRLEIIMCDSECASWKPTIITLALIQCEIERFFSNEIPSKSSYYSLKMLHLLRTVVDLQLICLIKPIEFHSCHKRIFHLLGEYDNHSRIHSSHNLKWYFQTQTYTIKHYRNYFYMQTILEE